MFSTGLFTVARNEVSLDIHQLKNVWSKCGSYIQWDFIHLYRKKKTLQGNAWVWKTLSESAQAVVFSLIHRPQPLFKMCSQVGEETGKVRKLKKGETLRESRFDKRTKQKRSTGGWRMWQGWGGSRDRRGDRRLNQRRCGWKPHRESDYFVSQLKVYDLKME